MAKLTRVMTLVVVAGVTCVSAAEPAAKPTTRPAVAPENIRPILTPETRNQAARKLIDRFVAHVQSSEDLNEEAKQAVARAWKQERAGDEPGGFLAAVGIEMISEPFRAARKTLDEEKYPEADRTLRTLVKNSDPYVSLHAAAMLARSLVEQDRLEEAQKVLTPLATREKELMSKTFLEAETDFLLGYCQLANLRYDKAEATLAEFTRQHPGAPERFRLPANQMLQELLARQPDRLGDVSDLMNYSGRRLSHGETDEQVQGRQQRAVELLTVLIAEAEEQEKQCPNCKGKGCKKCGKGCKKCGGKGCKACGGGKAAGNQQPGSPANRSALPAGSSEIGDLNRSRTAKPGKMWGEMRDKDRQRILQSLEQNFPARYRKLVEQYYKQLAKEP